MRKTLILTNGQIKRLITMPEALKAVEEAFLSYGKDLVQMPAKIYLHLDKYNGDFRAMPAYIGGAEAAGLKWVNVHPENRRFGMPTVMAVIILSDPKTGMPLCIMGGTHITNLRTGAAGAIAARCLARKESSIVGLVGCGVQARMQIEALKEFFKIKMVYIWGNRPALAKGFSKEMRSLGLNSKVIANISDCVKEADIVVTTTPVRKPIVKFEWIKEGTHINAIGADAPGKEELEPALVKHSKIVVDDWAQASHSGEINVPLSKGVISKRDIFAALGDIVTGKTRGRTDPEEITIFDSTGLAIQDLSVANLIYRKARGNKTGKWIKLL